MLNEILAGLLDLSEQYNECALKVKLENLIRTELTTDNVAKFFSIADKFKAKVRNVCFVYYDHQIVCSVIILWLVRQNFVSNKNFGCYFTLSNFFLYNYLYLPEFGGILCQVHCWSHETCLAVPRIQRAGSCCVAKANDVACSI